MLFTDFNISKEIIDDLGSHGIINPTKVQEVCIPLILKGRDIVAQSETGSGKTIAFAIPTINACTAPAGRIEVIVVAPTRELAKQISEEYEKYSKSKKLRVALVYGGVSIEEQERKVKGADILVGTPGRILDLLRREVLNFTYCKTFILDEADKMLEMGFIEDINEIIRHLPVKRQNLMFSATVGGKVARLMETYMSNPEKVILENIIEPGILEECYYDVPENQKLSLLAYLLREATGLVLVFCKTKTRTEFVAGVLSDNKFKAAALNGDMSQNLREKIMGDFAKAEVKILVATDVAARGLHVDNVDLVVNYDVPDDEKTYTHRIGRTARNGKHGKAITLLSDRDYDVMRRLQKSHYNVHKKELDRFPPIRISRAFPTREELHGGFHHDNNSRYRHSDGGNRGRMHNPHHYH